MHGYHPLGEGLVEQNALPSFYKVIMLKSTSAMTGYQTNALLLNKTELEPSELDCLAKTCHKKLTYKFKFQ